MIFTVKDVKDQVRVEQSFADFLRAVTLKENKKREQLEAAQDEELPANYISQSNVESGQVFAQ